MTRTVALSVTLILPLFLIRAQETRGDIRGRVTDPSGAVVAGVRVRVVSAATNVAATTATNDSGDYLLPLLMPGRYSLSAEAAGFKTHVQKEIELQVNGKLTVDIRMEIGSASENVTVVGDVPLVESASASLGTVIDPRRVSDLPLTHGNPVMLSSLSPGVMNLATSPWTRPFDNITSSSISVDGSRSGTNEYTLDGSPDTGGQRGNVGFVPPTVAVQEFKIQTATFDASYGYSTGAVVNMSLKSGTNELHGDLHEFVQNTVLNANSFFSNAAGRNRDISRLNRWGATGAGPIALPGVYNGKNRSFWMMSYEGLADYFPRETLVLNVPAANQKQGDFSNLLKLGPAYQLYDPFSTTPTTEGRYSRQPVPGNVIPSSRIDPTATKILGFYPNPNLPGTADGTNNWTAPNSDIDHFYTYVFRVDHNFSDRDRLFIRGNMNHRDTQGQYRFNGGYGLNQYRDNPGLAVDEVHMFTPTLLLNLRASYSRFRDAGSNPTHALDLAQYGFSTDFIDQLKAADPRGVYLPHINISGVADLSNGSNYNGYSDTVSLVGNVTKTLGAHSLRFGSEARIYRFNNTDLEFSSGDLAYSTNWTRGPLDNSAAAPMGQGLASFLYGLPTSGSIISNDSSAAQQVIPSVYVQDDWKVNSRLTLNFGLRYELSLPMTERFNRSVRGFDTTVALPISGAVLANFAENPPSGVPADQFRVRGGLTFAGADGESRSLWDNKKSNVAPRMGLAYQVDRRTVIRAGYGIFLDLDRQSVNQTGFSRSTALVPTLDNGVTYSSSTANPFPGGYALANGKTQGLMTNAGLGISFFNPDLLAPYAQRWQFGIQRQLAQDSVLEVSYVGNRGTRLRTTRNLDAIPRQYYSTLPTRDRATIDFMTAAVANPFYPLLPGTDLAASTVARSQLLRPFPQFTNVSYTTNEGYSWYHSLQARFERRFSGGFTTTVAYTYSKFMEAVSFLNETDPRPGRVISDQDRPQRLVVSGVYELPFGKGRRWLGTSGGVAGKLIGGWQMQGIFQGQSGPALGFGDAIFNGDLKAIPIPNGDRTAARWFNVDAGFVRASAQQRQWDLRTFPTRFSGVRGDGINNVDCSIIKNTQIGERVSTQFRGEFTNLFNHAQFTVPNTTPASTAFGRVSGLTTFPRVIQLGLRVRF